MVYGGGSVVGVESSGDSDGGSSNCYSKSADPVSDLLPDSYSELDVFSL